MLRRPESRQRSAIIHFTLWVFLCTSLFASSAMALEIEPPQFLSLQPFPEATTSIPAWVGLMVERRAADGWFDQNAGLQSETFSILETRFSLLAGLVLHRRVTVSMELPLISRTLNRGEGTTSDSGTETSDVTQTGLGDTIFTLSVLAWNNTTAAVEGYISWKPPTGSDDLVQAGADTPPAMTTIPLGTGNHEVDLGAALRYRAGTRIRFTADGWAGFRLRTGQAPFWMTQSGLWNWGSSNSGPARPHQMFLGSTFGLKPTGDWPGLEVTASWHHPLAAVSTNLLAGRASISKPWQNGIIRFGIEGPLYGKFFPDPYPSFFLNRQPSLGLSVRGEVALWF